MSDSIRIRTSPNGEDKYIKTQINQDFDFIEILSLKISQEDAYDKFCSDYGTIVGRVSINSGFGVPNAKVSVFIPLDDVDKDDPLISGLYPYEVITDKNDEGVRYNLLPKDGDDSNTCSTPIGSFPNKREVLDNEAMLDVYCKYYKFTTTTNNAGDYMIFGVPLGTYTVHVDADISDIGIASQRPYDLISQGTPKKLFDSSTKFKGATNLDKLVQVKTMNAGVNVQPFWGDPENCEVGINRIDFDLNYTLRPTAIFMGSIFGDQDKHSINKRCRPRRKFGELCDQVTGEGTIEMIRKTDNGEIEEFSVDGGRVIDENGAWAYQIPMNLDYMITDEEGNLQPSGDPNKGIPTRASVRFKIGLDQTGGEGRLRTRAKYLVPNNPQNVNEVDYDFGENTKDSSFRDLHWNKIYSVSNFITRFQKNPIADRAMTAVKNVDDCAGDKTPFPFNKVNTVTNPLFIVICIIIKIIGALIWFLNIFLIRLLNGIITILNAILKVICKIVNVIIGVINTLPGVSKDKMQGGNCDTPFLDYIPCQAVECDGAYYAPGCSQGDKGFAAAGAKGVDITYCNDCDANGNGGPIDLVGLDNCIAFQMAKVLNLFQYDFYNDWVNGSLYSYLLKYKKKKNGKEKFCDYDCGDEFPGGVDGNGIRGADNRCQRQYLLDSCYRTTDNIANLNGKNHQNEDRSHFIYEGLIKRYDDDFYYAAKTHWGTGDHYKADHKLFATELITLGSVLDCDWQGIPKIQESLIPTSYKLPPDTNELGVDGVTVETCGVVDIHKDSSQGLFFSINCLGLHVDYRQCLNLRHISEIGSGLNESNDGVANATCIIGELEMDDNKVRLFRDVFYDLNKNGADQTSFSQGPYTTNFNTANIGVYNFATGSPANGNDYSGFRGYPLDDQFTQPEHSFFFYFGLLPGKTAVDKLNQDFFAPCVQIVDVDIIISVKDINRASSLTSADGGFTFRFLGGVGPYTYTITEASSIMAPINGSLSSNVDNNGSIELVLNNLKVGRYVIAGVDSLGNPVSQSVSVSGPPSLYGTASVTKQSTDASINDGEITISDVGGGTGPSYTFTLTSSTSTTTVIDEPILSTPKVISGLDIDDGDGYGIIFTDSAGDTVRVLNMIISGPSIFTATETHTDTTCYDGSDGEISITVNGGVFPYTFTTTANNGMTLPDSGLLTGLKTGTYTTNIIDSSNTSIQITTVINSLHQQLSISEGSNLDEQCDSTKYVIPFNCGAGCSSPLKTQYKLSAGWVDVLLTTPPVLEIPKSAWGSAAKINIRIKSSDGVCFSNELVIDEATVRLPDDDLKSTLNGNTLTTVGGFPPYYLVTGPNPNDKILITATYTANGLSLQSVIKDSKNCTVNATT